MKLEQNKSSETNNSKLEIGKGFPHTERETAALGTLQWASSKTPAHP